MTRKFIKAQKIENEKEVYATREQNTDAERRYECAVIGDDAERGGPGGAGQ
jgi:hypothetical protein